MEKSFSTFWMSQPGLFLMLQAIYPEHQHPGPESPEAVHGSTVWIETAAVMKGLLMKMMIHNELHDGLESISEFTECGCGGMENEDVN